jgi:outer membrane protein, heavy metal efflux system
MTADVARRVQEVLVPARTRAFEQTLLLYNAMQVDIFRMLSARRDQIAAGREFIRSASAYWQARATLEQVLLGRLAGTLNEVSP